MQITKINYSQNFGLKKTDSYTNVENKLISKGIADIAKFVPSAKLDYSVEHNKFLLNTGRDIYAVGSVNKKNPFLVLAKLYENLSNFDNGGGSGFPPVKTNKIHKY